MSTARTQNARLALEIRFLDLEKTAFEVIAQGWLGVRLNISEFYDIPMYGEHSIGFT
eukprot:SAG11_NODE_27892_length_327_cov_1.394737_1_plen_56_part_01